MKSLLLLYLAQTPAEGLGFIQTIVAGGPALILAVLVVILGYFSYVQLRANNTLERGFREKIEELLREMLGRDREAQEATLAAIQVVEGFAEAMKKQRVSCDASAKLIEDAKRLIETQHVTLQSLAERIRGLDDEIRRGRNV